MMDMQKSLTTQANKNIETCFSLAAGADDY